MCMHDEEDVVQHRYQLQVNNHQVACALKLSLKKHHKKRDVFFYEINYCSYNYRDKLYARNIHIISSTSYLYSSQ